MKNIFRENEYKRRGKNGYKDRNPDGMMGFFLHRKESEELSRDTPMLVEN